MKPIFSSGSYRLRVESMLLKAEFAADMSFLEPAIAAMIYAGQGSSPFLLNLDWTSLFIASYKLLIVQQ